MKFKFPKQGKTFATERRGTHPWLYMPWDSHPRWCGSHRDLLLPNYLFFFSLEFLLDFLLKLFIMWAQNFWIFCTKEWLKLKEYFSCRKKKKNTITQCMGPNSHQLNSSEYTTLLRVSCRMHRCKENTWVYMWIKRYSRG